MQSRLVSLLIALVGLLALSGGAVLAQSTADIDAEGVIVRVGGEITVGADETPSTVVMVDGDVTIDGRVTDVVWVTNGTATINGQVDGWVFVLNGTLRLAAGSTVHDVSLLQSQLERAEGATVTGEYIDRLDTMVLGVNLAIFTFMLWIGVSLLILLAGLAFAAFGYRQLVDAAWTLPRQPGQSILAALVIWIGLPLLAVLAFVTVVGIPIGVTILFLVLPVFWLLGYIVAGEILGVWLGHLVGLQAHRFLSVVIGLVALQLINLIPFGGGLVSGLAGLLGAGALAYRMFQGATGRPQTVPPVPAPSQL